MKTFGLLLLLAALAGSACGVEDDERPVPTPVTTPSAAPSSTEEPAPTVTPECDEKCQTQRAYTPEPTQTPAPPAPSHPAGTRTGEPEVDAVIEAIESRDAATLTSLIRLSSEPCEGPRPVQPQPLRCPDGVAEGTPLVGLWVSHVEGGLWMINEAEAANRILSYAADKSWRLHSVYSYNRAGTRAEYLPETDYFITFAAFVPQQGPDFDNLRIIEGKITHLHFAFPEPYNAWENSADRGWLLPRAR